MVASSGDDVYEAAIMWVNDEGGRVAYAETRADRDTMVRAFSAGVSWTVEKRERDDDEAVMPRVIIHRLSVNRFNYLTVIAQPDTELGEVVTATVLFGGYPVAMMTTDDEIGEVTGGYRMLLLWDNAFEEGNESERTQAYIAFTVEAGVATMADARAWLDGDVEFTAVAAGWRGDGRAWAEFAGEVAHAMHTAYPEFTPVPTISSNHAVRYGAG